MANRLIVDKTPFLKIKARFESGESVPRYAVAAAEDVLGEKFIRRGVASRPDVHDRAAGDDSFGDEAVVL